MAEPKAPTFTLDGADYNIDSLDAASNKLLEDISTIESEINRHVLSANIAKIAKDTLITKIKESVDTFEKV
jgi:hypothetical protein